MGNCKKKHLLFGIALFLACTMNGQQTSNNKREFPDWALGGFVRPQNANPIISPDSSTFYCPLSKKYIAWRRLKNGWII